MCTPLISFETVREIMTSWMTQYTETWTNEGFPWKYESYGYDFSWYKYEVATSEESTEGPGLCWHKKYRVTPKALRVGASLSDEGAVITIWTGVNDNDNIIISKDDIIFNDHSDFDEGFDHGPMYWLYTKLKSHALSNSTNCHEPIEEETKKEPAETPKGVIVRTKFDLDYFKLYNAYAVYDEAGECKHGILRYATENKLEFVYNCDAGRTLISVSIDDYLNKKFKIKPLVVSEQ